jgi:YbgC/YbaW family acyl-CoA thioester hydrolase
MKREFRHPYTVRYDECNCDNSLTPATFLRYMQDIAGLDAEDAHLNGNGFWIAKRTVLSFNTPIPVHTPLELTTYGIGFTRITAQRGYDAHIVGDDSATPVISARTLWVYLDTRGRPIRIPEDTARIWLPDGASPQPSEVPWPGQPQAAPDTVVYRVRFSDVDQMKHMNNAAYVEAFDNAAWEAYSRAGIMSTAAHIDVLAYDIDYAESARFGDQLEIQSWFDPFPSVGKEFSRFQQIVRKGVVLVRARSRWIWRE